MVLTLIEAEIGKTYRIAEIVNMSHQISERLRLEGVVRESKIVLKDITSYGYCLIEVIHPNGDLIRSSVPNKAAKRIHLRDEDFSNFIVINVEDIIEIDDER